MSQTKSVRVSRSLVSVRTAFAAAQKEYESAFSASGFNPARADKALVALEVAKAALAMATARESSVLQLERSTDWVSDRLEALLQRVLPAVERQLTFALREANIKSDRGLLFTEDHLETLDGRLRDGREMVERALKTAKGESQKARMERGRGLIAEAQFRLDEVRRIRDQIADLAEDLGELFDELSPPPPRQAAAG